MHTLRARLIALMVLLAATAIVSVSLFTRHLSISVVRAARLDGETAAFTPLRIALQNRFADSGWEGVRRQLPEVARVSGRQLLLTDTLGRLVATAPAEMHPGDFTLDATGALTRWLLAMPAIDSAGGQVIARQRGIVAEGGVPRVDLEGNGGRRFGRLYAIPLRTSSASVIMPAASYPPLALAAGAIALTAILVTWLLSRRVLGPVEQLTAAATAMAGGDLERRVAVSGRDEIAVLATAFNAMAEAVVRTQRQRRAMTNDIAHELRTPLTNIRCTVESLADGMVASSPAVVASLQEEVQLLQRLIEDLQDVALAEVGELRLRCETLSAGAEVTASVQSLARDAAMAHVTLRGEAGGSVALVADHERVQQMLRNLIRNAITHTPAGGTIVVTVSVPRAEVVEFSVQDSGAGIAEEQLGEIFQRFYRLDPSRSRDTGGAGLGLAIVKGLAEAHGGTVDVRSVVGSGSCFRIALPAAGPNRPPS